MSPNEATMESNRENVLEASAKYGREFVERPVKKFEQGDTVLISNETKADKMDDEFSEQGKVCRVLENDTYEVEIGHEKFLRGHGSQLRIWPGMLVIEVTNEIIFMDHILFVPSEGFVFGY